MIRLVERRIAPIAAAATVLLAAPVAAAAATIPYAVTLDGVGGVVPGMGGARVRALWGIAVPSPRLACATTRFHRAPGDVAGDALFLHGRFAAVFFTSGASTPSGVAIGSPFASLREDYGRRLHTVRGSNTYFLTRLQSPHWQLRFDVARGRVTLIGFGNAAVHFVGGCGS